MRLLYRDFRFVFEFNENTRNLLVIEHPGIFCRMVKELFREDLDEETGFVLSENEVPVKKKDHLLCIVDPLSISLNEKKLLGRLIDVLKKEICSSELLIESSQIIASLENYALHMIQNADWELTYTDKIDVLSLLKFVGIQFQDRQDSLIEKLFDYIKAVHELLGIRCFIFVNLFSYLTEYEIEKLYEYVQYQKVYLLLIESRRPEKIEKFTKIVIIDKDACEILLNM